MNRPTTDYFKNMRLRPDRKIILDDWIEHVILRPEVQETQGDGRIRKWGRIGAFENRWLRVILLEDGETVHNAFFDRDKEG